MAAQPCLGGEQRRSEEASQVRGKYWAQKLQGKQDFTRERKIRRQVYV